MKKKNEAFTLIELLAIIVILAIIAVITVPIILNIIDNSRKGAAINSAYGFVDAINKKYLSSMIDGSNARMDGTYSISDGKITGGIYSNEEINISGTKPTSGTLTFKNNKLQSGCIVINEYEIRYQDGNFTSEGKGNCGEIVNNTPTPPPITYTVSFNVGDGSSVSSQTIEIGENATLPTAPTREGYTFGGWYLDGEFTQPYDFENEVMDDVTLHAKWIEIAKPTYTVSFNSNGGNSVSSQTIEEGQTAAQPINPTRSGYDFSGWYSDSGLTQSFNFNTAITNNITLYAKWTQVINNYTVTFNTMGGNSISSQTIEHGGTATRPADPTRSGYEFTWWYTDPYTQDYSTRYSFNTAVTSSITLYAGWNRIYTVSYVTNGTRDRDDDIIREGETIARSMCSSLEKSGYYFVGWYTNSGLTNPFPPYTPITSDITLYGKWQALPSSGSSFTFTVEGTQFTTTYGTTWNQFIGNGKSVNGGSLIVHSATNDVNVIFDSDPNTRYDIASYDDCITWLRADGLIRPGEYLAMWPVY